MTARLSRVGSDAWSPRPMVPKPESERPASVDFRDFLRRRSAPAPPAGGAQPGWRGRRPAATGPDHRDRFALLGLVAQFGERVPDGRRVPGPVGGGLGHQGHDQLVEGLGDFLDLGTGPRGRLVQVAVHQYDRRAPLERRLAAEHLVQHDTQGVQVGLVTHRRRAADLFRGHERRRSQRPARGRERGRIQVLGDTEVGQLDLAVRGYHQVGRLQVAVHDSVLVGVMERLADLDPKLDHLAPRHRSAIGEHILQGDPLDELHRDVGGPFVAPDGQEADDVGVAKLLKNLRLAVEPLDNLLARIQFAGDNLDGGRPSVLFVGRAIDDPHRPRAQHRLDSERSELFADLYLRLRHDREDRLQTRGMEHDRPPAAGR